MPMIPNEREYRNMSLLVRKAEEGDEKNYRVEGYATTFDDPYELFSFEDITYYEKIDRHAFDEADMSDVIFQYDHEGMVYARQSNGTLVLDPDEKGLHIEADLSLTEEARKMYEAINTGLVVHMSWAFTVRESKYDTETHTRTITKVKKVYDVSAVSIPANPSTYIAARSYIEGEIEKERQELMAAEAQERAKKKLRLLMELES